jgi:hypothetical protein
MREKDQVLTVATLEARSANEAIVDPMVGSAGVYVWREYGVRWSVLRWFVWWESGSSLCEGVFTLNPLKKFYKFCTFIVICEDSNKVYAVQHKRFIALNGYRL